MQGPRAQIDRELYKKYMQHTLLYYPNLDVRAGSVFDLVLNHTKPPPYVQASGQNVWATIDGIRLGRACSRPPPGLPYSHIKDTGEIIKCTQVVICTGTFLSGEIHIGVPIPLCLLL